MEQGWPGLAQYIPSNPADWNPRPRTVQDALDQLAAGGTTSPAANMFVWQPGGTAADNIYVTLPALEAALQTTAGPKIIGVDTTHGAAVIDTTGMPAGGWRFNDTTWVPALATTALLITIAVGAKFDPSTQNLAFRYGTEVQNNATATVWTPTNGLANLRLDTSVIDNTTTGAFLDCTTNITIVILENASVIASDGTHPAIKIEAAGTCDMAVLTGSELESTAVGQGAAPGGVAQIQYDGSSVVSSTQGAGPVYTFTALDPTPTFVFAPGATGTLNRNVYTTPDALRNALNLLAGQPRTLVVDDSAGAAHLTTGAHWNLDNCTLISAFPTLATGTLLIDDGAIIDATNLVIDESLTVSSAATATAPITVSTGTCLIYVRGGAVLQSTTGVAFGSLTGAGTLDVFAEDIAQLGDGTNPAISAAAGHTARIFASGQSSVLAHALAGLGTCAVRFDGSSTVSTTQGVTTLTLTQVRAPNFVQSATTAGTGTTTTTAVTGNIQRAGSGKVRVQGVATGLISANGTITVSLLRDATPILALPAITVLATTGFSIPINFIDTLPDNATHTYTVQAVADGAHTITAPAGSNLISAQEIGA